MDGYGARPLRWLSVLVWHFSLGTGKDNVIQKRQRWEALLSWPCGWFFAAPDSGWDGLWERLVVCCPERRHWEDGPAFVSHGLRCECPWYVQLHRSGRWENFPLKTQHRFFHDCNLLFAANCAVMWLPSPPPPCVKQPPQPSPWRGPTTTLATRIWLFSFSRKTEVQRFSLIVDFFAALCGQKWTWGDLQAIASKRSQCECSDSIWNNSASQSCILWSHVCCKVTAEARCEARPLR